MLLLDDEEEEDDLRLALFALGFLVVMDELDAGEREDLRLELRFLLVLVGDLVSLLVVGELYGMAG